MTLLTTSMSSPLGPLRLLATERALVGIYLPEHKGAPDHRGQTRDDHPVFLAARQQLAQYFAGTRQAFDLPLDPAGTPFQRSVWRALLAIPFGATRTYAELAQHIGSSAGAARAIGAANARNPISIVVPCHRIVGKNGALTGYAGGVPAKRWLLDHEAKRAAQPY